MAVIDRGKLPHFYGPPCSYHSEAENNEVVFNCFDNVSTTFPVCRDLNVCAFDVSHLMEHFMCIPLIASYDKLHFYESVDFLHFIISLYLTKLLSCLLNKIVSVRCATVG